MEKIYKNVNKELLGYIKNNVFPEYDKNDKGHGILHILEVIRRSFELKKSLSIDHLDDDLIFAIASILAWFSAAAVSASSYAIR